MQQLQYEQEEQNKKVYEEKEERRKRRIPRIDALYERNLVFPLCVEDWQEA